MAKSVNKVILIGNLGKDPDVKVTPSGTTVANFTLATNDRTKDKNGRGRTAPNGTTWWPGNARPKLSAST